MEEKTLLTETEKEQKKIEEKFLEQKGNIPSENIKVEEPKPEIEEQSETKKYSRPSISAFSAKSFQNDALSERLEKKYAQLNKEDNIEEQDDYIEDSEIKEEQQPSVSKSSTIIERPNYDFIEELSPEQRGRIFKIEEQENKEETKPKTSRIKNILIAILFAIFGVWGIINIATLDSLGGQISSITTEYDINLISYLNNLHNLDATNGENMENLFQTIPKDEVLPSSIGEQSNWFDRFCNFIAGLFGG